MNPDKISQLFTQYAEGIGQRLQDIYRVDNNGSDLIKNKYPHLWSRLESLTYNWSLVGKYVLNNADLLRGWIKNYKDITNVFPNGNPPMTLVGATKEDYHKAMEEAIAFMEAEILPVLEKNRPHVNLSEPKTARTLGSAPPTGMLAELSGALKELVDELEKGETRMDEQEN